MAAWLTLAVIDVEFLFEISWFSILAKEVAKRRAPLRDGFSEDVFDVLRQFDQTWFRDSSCGSGRVNAAAEQGLAGVDVPDSDYDFGVHDVLFDAGGSACARADEIVGVECLFEWFWPEMLE